MSSSHFANRHRKDLSTDMIRTKIAHRKSLSQKENRHKEYERNRHFGLKDVNIPALEGRILFELDETSQELVPENASVKPRSTKTILGDQRKQMLQKYKEEKQLQKLKEQREKAKRGIFKVGLYRPDMPCFLLSNQNIMKAEPKKIDNESDVRAIRAGQRQTEKKVLDKEKKAVQPVMPLVRMTRSATQAAKQMARTVSSTTARKPVTRATNGNEAERKAPNQGRSAKKIETKPDKSETEKLTSYCLEWDRKLELDIPDDAKDLIRTAVGQTRLLMKERFKQFEGLVDNCEYKQGEKETTCTDLDGFWDMVSFQIEDVNQKFNNLTKLEESGWQNNNNTSKKVFRKKVVSSITSKPKQDDGGRIAARNRLAAIKSALRERMKQEERAEAAASAMPREVDKVVFDAGFFRIESPVKSFSGLSSECLSQRLRTPNSVSKAMSESRPEMGLLRQTAPENPDPQSTKSEHVEKTLISNISENRNSIVEDAKSPGLQVLTEVDHDINKKNSEIDCVPNERMSLALLAGKVADDVNTNKKEEISHVVEGMELNSVIAQDVWMISPEKNIPSQNNISQEEETKISQSASFEPKVGLEDKQRKAPQQDHTSKRPIKCSYMD
ncbi:Disks large-associated protein 5 [Camelus dromedarius]|uniref:Disks large-associated protein 5 n=1 Tax=Camelus dromedarius TaxID=9838 RepID=A0A5N4E2G0_CAMDR|nr:Disks large-associated protein 5 [Camelus dromedarius]